MHRKEILVQDGSGMSWYSPGASSREMSQQEVTPWEVVSQERISEFKVLEVEQF